MYNHIFPSFVSTGNIWYMVVLPCVAETLVSISTAKILTYMSPVKFITKIMILDDLC